MNQEKKRPASTRVVLREAETAWRNDGTRVRRYLSPNRRLEARVTATSIRLERSSGEQGPGIRFTSTELALLVSLAKAWARERGRWHALYRHFSGVGSPSWHYVAPGDSQGVLVGFHGEPGLERKLGREVERPTAAALAGEWRRTARLFQIDSPLASGEVEVGAVYEAAGVRATARWRDLHLQGRGRIALEAGEETFLAALQRFALPPQPPTAAASGDLLLVVNVPPSNTGYAYPVPARAATGLAAAGWRPNGGVSGAGVVELRIQPTASSRAVRAVTLARLEMEPLEPIDFDASGDASNPRPMFHQRVFLRRHPDGFRIHGGRFEVGVATAEQAADAVARAVRKSWGSGG